jgi:hypothetical protein
VKGRFVVQQISRHDFRTPGALVGWLGAVQAQDYGAAKWALGLRLSGKSTDDLIERAVDDGVIIRTHAMRWTWQFVSPADVRWLLALVAPRLVSRAGRRHRELGLDAATLRKSNAVIEKALGDGRHWTRDEIAERLSKSRISPAGQRLPHILAFAELEGLICSGARRGKQSTYALLDARVLQVGKPVTRDEALSELARRYFLSRGPATVADFTWWSGLAPADARDGLESVESTLASEVVGGRKYYRGDRGRSRAASGVAYLLPAFDEYLVAYRDRETVLEPRHVQRINAGGGMLGPCVVVDERVVGTWRRELGRSTVAVEIRTFEKPSTSRQRAITSAARRYGAFLDREAECRFY